MQTTYKVIYKILAEYTIVYQHMVCSLKQEKASRGWLKSNFQGTFSGEKSKVQNSIYPYGTLCVRNKQK